MSSIERSTYAEARHAMVDEQLRRRGIADERVLRAMRDIPREEFVPGPSRISAYGDHALSIGGGQTISQPYMVARTCELAAIGENDRVLDVGSGSGYQAAVLSRLAAMVIGIELLPDLAERSRVHLTALGVDNVTIFTGDGTLGYPALAPYDAIVVAAGAPAVPEPLVEQLAVGGRLVIPLGDDVMQRLTVLHKTEQGIDRQPYDGCVYVPLRGGGGWADRPRA
jgi:protein-L-isoaspartate(D-aspartate) O-methyltransferase